MDRTLQWKVLTLLAYIAALTAFLVICGDGALPSHPTLPRLPSPL